MSCDKSRGRLMTSRQQVTCHAHQYHLHWQRKVAKEPRWAANFAGNIAKFAGGMATNELQLPSDVRERIEELEEELSEGKAL